MHALVTLSMERFSKEGSESLIMCRLHCIHIRIGVTMSRLREEISSANAIVPESYVKNLTRSFVRDFAKRIIDATI